ncbi:MAG TPA: hypothetical protein VIZ28_10400 [Chitinophagaceae bacterium]
MNPYIRNIILLSFALLIVFFILFSAGWYDKYSDTKNILIGIISSVILILIIEVRDLIRDNSIYGHLDGPYKRQDIFNIDGTKTSDTKYVSMMNDYRDVLSEIKLKYVGAREYKCEIYYKEGITKATFFIDITNNKIATGKYQYTVKYSDKATMPDLGTFELHVDELNDKRLYVFHKNLIPSGLASGYEIWERE